MYSREYSQVSKSRKETALERIKKSFLNLFSCMKQSYHNLLTPTIRAPMSNTNSAIFNTFFSGIISYLNLKGISVMVNDCVFN